QGRDNPSLPGASPQRFPKARADHHKNKRFSYLLARHTIFSSTSRKTARNQLSYSVLRMTPTKSSHPSDLQFPQKCFAGCSCFLLPSVNLDIRRFWSVFYHLLQNLVLIALC